MYLAIIFLPFISFTILVTTGRFIGRLGSIQMSTILLLTSHFFALIIFFHLYRINQSYYITLISWIDCGLFYVNWSLIYDPLSISMLTMVSFIASMVIIYSGSYMDTDPFFQRFLSYLALFTFLMFILITSDNFIQLFFGWEGVGLCSYLLISFWNTRVQANKAAIQALVLNRVGDIGFLLGVVFIYYVFRSVDFNIVFALIPLYQNATFFVLGKSFNIVSLICLFLFIGACGKSAQIGLHCWLPKAMEGPTPVSALIHAATMVTAGVFLIIRSSFLFEAAPYILTFVTLLGTITAFITSTIGLFQFDIKKVIAYSTCSQLGYMVFCCGLSQYNAAIFHLINHAFFKALLFLTAGSIIHSLNGEQDMRKMGQLIKILPSTYNSLITGSFALAGIPFLSGFYSKDFILELAYSHITFHSSIAFWFGSLSAFFTAFYSFRVIFLVFFSKSNSPLFYFKNIHEYSLSIGLVLNILTFCSIFFAYFVKDFFIGFGTFYWANSLYSNPMHFLHFDIEFIPILVKWIPTFLTFFGFLMGFILFSETKIIFYKGLLVLPTIFFNNKWFFDLLYNYYIGYNVLAYCYKITYILLDKGILELIGGKGLVNMALFFNSRFKQNQLGFISFFQQMLIFSCFLFIFFSLFV